MGSGITIAHLLAGFSVALVDAKKVALDRGLGMVRKSLMSAVKRGVATEAKARAAEKRLTWGTSLAAVKDCDLVIEAVFENLGLKKAIFEELDGVCRPGAILCTNTSTLDVDKIARSTGRPEMVMGMHFFSPAHVMPLVECIRGEDSAPATIAAVMRLTKKLRKVGVLVGNCDGFVGNRMLKSYTDETMFLLEEGATPRQIDRAVKAFGMAMGPLQMADVAGNDIQWLIRKERGMLDPTKRDPHERYCSLGDKMCEAGRFGQKAGKGWYRYEEGSRKPLDDPEVAAIIDSHRRETGSFPREISDHEIVARCFYPLINEGFRCLEEGMAEAPGDIDVIWAYGYSWPRWRGGPMFLADEIGLAELVSEMRAYKEKLPGVSHWEPCTLLEMLASKGETLKGHYSSGGGGAVGRGARSRL